MKSVSGNVIQFPVKTSKPNPFPIMSRKDGCHQGYRQTYDDGMPEWDICGWCNGEGCK